MIRSGFSLCLLLEGGIDLYQLHLHHMRAAGWYLAAAYVTTIAFAWVYMLFVHNDDGDIVRDSLNGRHIKTARSYLRRMGLFCAGLSLTWAAYYAPTFDLVKIGLPLFGVFATIIFLGIITRIFEGSVSLDQDLGVKAGS